jgi:hypothetical protein
MIKKKKSKRKPTKQGLSTISKVLIGGAIAGGLYFLYDKFFAADAPNNSQDDENKVVDGATAGAILTGIDPGSGGKPPVIINDSNKRKLTAIGTPGSKQNWGMLLYKGDKGGEIETLQSLFNRISKAYGKTGIKKDGIFGNNTEQKRVSIVGGKPGITLNNIYTLTKNVEAAKSGKGVTYDNKSGFDFSNMMNA